MSDNIDNKTESLANTGNTLPIKSVIGGVMLAGLAAISYVWLSSNEPSTDNNQKPNTLPKSTVEAPPHNTEPLKAVQLPESAPELEAEPSPAIISADTAVEAPEVAKPKLPPLFNSTDWMKARLSTLYSTTQYAQKYEKMWVNRELINNFVVFIDNAAKGDLTHAFSPLKLPATKYTANAIEDGVHFLETDQSTERYSFYVQLLLELPEDQAQVLYTEITPLLEQAYAELGYEGEDFHQQVVTTIDLLIATPDLNDVPLLLSPSVMYHYADEDLESLQPIQKLLLRMGSQHQATLKTKLLKLRTIAE